MLFAAEYASRRERVANGQALLLPDAMHRLEIDTRQEHANPSKAVAGFAQR